MNVRDEERWLLEVAEALADGRPIKWDDLAAADSNLEASTALRQLRVLAALAEVHGQLPSRGVSSEVTTAWGRFELLGELGRGEFGVVYRAQDSRLDCDVALKLSPAGTADSDVSAVVAEARRLAMVRHPNVITVYGADIVDGVTGIWMELVSGRTLQEELQER